MRERPQGPRELGAKAVAFCAGSPWGIGGRWCVRSPCACTILCCSARAASCGRFYDQVLLGAQGAWGGDANARAQAPRARPREIVQALRARPRASGQGTVQGHLHQIAQGAHRHVRESVHVLRALSCETNHVLNAVRGRPRVVPATAAAAASNARLLQHPLARQREMTRPLEDNREIQKRW